VRLAPLARHNIVFGSNGSGKTSLLEAVHILGTARSFRSGKPRSQIQYGKDRYVVRGERRADRADAAALPAALGVQRALSGEVRLRLGSEDVRSVARLADELPLLVINSGMFDLLIGEPAQRRRFLDWGVFHVEHRQREARQRFQRALQQRNMLLRRGKIDRLELDVWTRDLAAQGEAVAAAREAFLKALEPAFRPIIAALAPELEAVELAYRRGWDATESFAETLKRSLDSDLEQGFTQSGPQRADLRVMLHGHAAAETLSRGQQKLLVTALKLAQGQLLADTGTTVLFLVDDLPAELDAARCERVCRRLSSMRAQTLITCVDAGAINASWLSAQEDEAVQVFHVKHGAVQQWDGRVAPSEDGVPR
jgi:DNA replication and repair protein RecF